METSTDRDAAPLARSGRSTEPRSAPSGRPHRRPGSISAWSTTARSCSGRRRAFHPRPSTGRSGSQRRRTASVRPSRSSPGTTSRARSCSTRPTPPSAWYRAFAWRPISRIGSPPRRARARPGDPGHRRWRSGDLDGRRRRGLWGLPPPRGGCDNGHRSPPEPSVTASSGSSGELDGRLVAATLSSSAASEAG